MKPRTQIITVKGVVFKDNKVLLLEDRNNKWELPGGRIDFGETPEQTLVREFSEELGISSVHIGTIINAWTFTVDRDDGERQYVVLVYTCQISDQALVQSDEHIKHEWFTLDDVETLHMREGYKTAIKLAFNILKT